MKKQFFLLASVALVLTGCEQYSSTTKTTTERADNTGRNVRDRDSQTLTPGDQAENEADRTVTKQVRRIIIEDGTLSTNAKNIKIITINGVVTLRGVVNNDREKNVIAQKAKTVNGVRNVDNQLEIVVTDDGTTSTQTRANGSVNRDE